MKNEIFEELLESAKEAKAIKNKELKPSRAFLMQEPNPKDIRIKLELTQAHFAALMNISVHTLRNWEQGRRQPEGPAKVLLNIVAEYPEVLVRA